MLQTVLTPRRSDNRMDKLLIPQLRHLKIRQLRLCWRPVLGRVVALVIVFASRLVSHGVVGSVEGRKREAVEERTVFKDQRSYKRVILDLKV